MKTVAQQLNIKEFPFIIKDNNGNHIYYEGSNRYWWKKEFDSNGKRIYYENSNGIIEDNRTAPCEGKLVEVDGIKYKLTKA